MNRKHLNTLSKYTRRTVASLLLGLAASSFAIKAEVVEIPPLFEYPLAPDSIGPIDQRSNWMMEHFWEPMDLKSKEPVNQTALNHAFQTYTFPMQWASEAEVTKSIDNLLLQMQKNPTLLYQFAKAAEENLYGTRAQLWYDAVYLKFLDAVLKNKKIKKPMKERFAIQHQILSHTKPGDVPPSFKFTTPVGNPGEFNPIGLLTVIEFGDPDCADCRMAKLKFDTDVAFSSLVDRGLVNMMFITVDPEEGWQTKLVDYPAKWVVGAAEGLSGTYDLRATPYFYIIGKDGKILAKTASYEQVMAIVKDQATKND